MGAPYRVPAERKDPAHAEEPRGGLGERRSSHGLGIGGVVASLLGAPGAGVDVHENGLVVWGAWGRRTEILFDDVDAIHHGYEEFFGRVPRLMLVTFAGQRVRLPSGIDDLDGVIDALDREVTRPIVARVKRAMTRGEPLHFGPLLLTLDGVVLHGERLPWPELACVVAEPHAFTFRARGPRGRFFGWVRLADLPHPRALIEALRMRTRVVVEGLRLGGTLDV
jgi:hypothetical protein